MPILATGTMRFSTIIAQLLILGALVGCGGKTTKQASNGSSVAPNVKAAVSELHMAKDDGKGNPGAQTDRFGPQDRTIHCVAELKAPKAGTPIRFTWWIVESQGAKDEKLEETDYTIKPGEEVVHGQITLPNDWPPGKYKVDVSLDGNLEQTVQFTVE